MPIVGSQTVISWGPSEPKKGLDNQPYPFDARGGPYPPPAFEFGEAMQSGPERLGCVLSPQKETGMHQLALGVAAAVALAIIVIGALYVSRPRAATRSFGLPLPEDGPNIAWWLRLKGVRDIAAGLTVLAMMVWGGPHMVGIILLVEALIPIGDMLVILAAKGSVRSAFGMHGLTALLMILAAVPLTMGAT